MVRYRTIYPEDFTDRQVDEIIAMLPAWRREECLRFKHRQGRIENALAYWLLSDMVGYQPEFTRGEHGKPTAKPSDRHIDKPGSTPISFNLSHCKSAVACAVSDEGEVGIDVECLGRYKPHLAEYCMSDDELSQISEADDPDAEFSLLWTMKEALLKMTGEGITDDMKGCLASDRMNGVELRSGIDRERGFAWAVAHRIILNFHFSIFN